VILIHGAGSFGAEMRPLADALAAYGPVTSPSLVGHGGRPVPERFSIEGFAADLLEGMDRAGVEKDFFVGYSSGGTIALYLARHHPERVIGACALAAKHVFDAATVKHWKHLADPERHERTGRAAILKQVNGPGWKDVVHANHRLWDDIGAKPPLTADDFKAIAVPVLLVNSNRDPIAPWEETLAHGKLIPGCELVMFYGAAHPITSVPVLPVARKISEWMTKIIRP
jgi:pimeloyl-ACP methyl ester carboxylesterase